MLIGIEASAAIVSGRTGVGTYAANMIAGLNRLTARSDDIRFAYFSNHNEPGDEDEQRGHGLQGFGSGMFRSRTLWMQLILPRAIRRLKPDLCHFPNYLAPFASSFDTPIIVTMYDMSVYRYPQYQPLKTVAVHRAIIPTMARRASLIVTISESARQDILHNLKLPPERVRVVYGGVGPQFQPYVVSDQPDVATVRQIYRLGAPYVLTVGTLEPRKNHCRLIAAFVSMVRQERLPHHLVVVGAHGWKERPLQAQIRESGMADRIHLLGYLPAPHLPSLYRGADAFAFPSIYEGFGLPVIEALACGAPTLISNDPALTEVAGTRTTEVVDPHSVDGIAAGLYRLISDTAHASRLRTAGLARARQFSWDRCAAETLALYREVLDDRTSSQSYAARRVS